MSLKSELYKNIQYDIASYVGDDQDNLSFDQVTDILAVLKAIEVDFLLQLTQVNPNLEKGDEN